MTARPEILATPLAVHGGRLAITDGATTVRYDFSVCLNAYGPADIVREAVLQASLDEYPDPTCRAPRQAAADRWNRSIDEVAFSAGAAELIHAVCFAYLRHTDIALIATPAFGEYERAVRLCSARVVTHALGDIARFCAEIAQQRPRLVFMCTPANPTGYSIGLPDLQTIADACTMTGSLLVLDQAYDAFSANPLGTPALPGHPAVLHLRSLTKEHALAGVRAAFAVGPPEIMRSLERARIPWYASSMAQAAGVAAFTSEATEHMRRTVSNLRAEAARLTEGCTHLGLEIHPSSTHFFVAYVGDAAKIQTQLLQQAGIYVRDCASFGHPTWIRIAARTPADNDILLNTLRAISPLEPSHLSNPQHHDLTTPTPDKEPNRQ